MDGNEKKPKLQVEITRMKGSGPGGQNRNKRETGIRIKDLQTGIVASATERRSQGQNLNAAFERLEKKIADAAYRPPPRKKARASNASRRKRLNAKKLHSTKKKNRGSRHSDD